MRTLLCLGAVVALSIGFESSISAQQEKKPKKRPNQVVDRGVDAPAAEAESDAPARNVEAIRYTLHPSGMVSAELDESFEEALVATRNADGTLSYTCVHGLPLAAKHVKAAKPGAKAASPALEAK